MRSQMFDSEEFKNNLQQYEKALENGEHIYFDIDELTELSDYYYMRGMYDKAKEVCDYTNALFPDSSLAKLLKVNTLLNIENDIEAAKEILEELDDKSDLEYAYTYFDILAREEDITEAIEFMEERYEELSDELKPDFILDTAEILIDNNYTDVAEEWLLKYPKGKENDEYKELKARIYFEDLEFEKASILLTDLLNKHPYDESLWCVHAKTMFMLNNFQEALNSCDFSIAIEPERNEAVQIKAYTLFTLNQFNDAIRLYKQYLEWFPNDRKSLEFLGYCHINIGNNEQAINCFLDVIRLSEDDDVSVDIYRTLAIAYSSKKDVENALKYLNKIKVNEDNYSMFLTFKGHILLENNEIVAAMKCYEEAIDKAVDKKECIVDIAISLYDNKMYSVAYSLIKACVDYVDDFPKGQACLALLAYKMGRKEDYFIALRKAVSKDLYNVKDILSDIFPDSVIPEDYYAYAKHNHFI